MTSRRGSRRSIARAGRLSLLLVLAYGTAASLLFAACSDSPAATDPQGPRADTTNTVWWTMFILAAVIFVGVMVLYAIALLRRREARPAADTVAEHDPRWGVGLILGGGLVFPVIVLAVLMVLSIGAIHDLTGDAGDDPLEVTVVAHDWWWEFRYGDGVVTANELHIPAGERVQLHGQTADVIHSFWVPQLAGKVDLISGLNRDFVIEADEPGTYRGQCAEFCGVQHAHMAIFVVAQPRAEFDQWLAAQRQPAAQPTGTALDGQELFLGLSCKSCHAISGTPADGRVGPDLTHLAARETIAAGTVPVDREHLTQWILDPGAYKPGANMPAFGSLDPASLDALVTYLLSLE
ncbi:MAG: cytochrome c oxidase subunit II [Hyphomicrobiales bacterium]